MTTAVRQRVTIQPGGKVEVQSNDLPPGSEAEVIVLVEPRAPSELSPLEAFRELQRRLRLTPEAAQKWIDEARAERQAWGKRLDSR